MLHDEVRARQVAAQHAIPMYRRRTRLRWSMRHMSRTFQEVAWSLRALSLMALGVAFLSFTPIHREALLLPRVHLVSHRPATLTGRHCSKPLRSLRRRNGLLSRRARASQIVGELADQYGMDTERTTATASKWRSNNAELDSLVAGQSQAIFQRDRVWEYVWSRPLGILQRGVFIASTVVSIYLAWQADAGHSSSKEEDDAYDPTSLKGPQRETARGKALRSGLAQMGVFFVKMGQTLAQRPDLVGDDVAEELKGLQERNAPFADEAAHQIIADDLGHKGPLAPDVHQAGCDESLPPLLKELEAKHVASASLGQVYRGRLHDGLEVALKVQRPGVRNVLGPDWAIAVLACQAYRKVTGSLNDYSFIVDTVAQGIRRELDYHHEAGNAEEFGARHTFLPFVSSPGWVPEYTGPKGTARVLCTKWYPSRAPSQLPRDERRKLVEMAVEACVVQLLITGFVHADPHEGNLRFGDDGRIVFLDFGLMDRVDFGIMECFAAGIRHVLNEDWVNLTRVMQEVRFTPTPLLKYTNYAKRELSPCTVEDFAASLEKSVRSETGGTSRFGSMATALKKMSNDYVMLTPPYVALLCRTFITLEGLLGDDPELAAQFNIYKVALPFALQRVLSPRTRKGVAALESVLLQARPRKPPLPNWPSLAALLASGGGSGEDAAEEKTKEYGGMEGVARRLLRTSEGSALRRLLYSVDLFEAVLLLLTCRSALPVRNFLEDALAERWSAASTRKEIRPKLGPRAAAASAEWGEWNEEDPFMLPETSRRTSRTAWRIVLRRQLRYSMFPPWRLPLRLSIGSARIALASVRLAFRAWRAAARKRRQAKAKAIAGHREVADSHS
mmetsp:Transcript_35285/g.64550  ORF Transcript_35285/g.64550 Transcript_35285/m.64550 type:complete len:844 (-) Transcript_35285:93-2624(-)